MQLAEFEVLGLFGRYDHRIKFPLSKAGESRPSLVILHGPNGVGKTTILRMIDGCMQLDFNVFREIPFKTAALKFNDGKSIQVTAAVKGKKKTSLEITFEKRSVSLHPTHSGPVKDAEAANVERFREDFLKTRSSLTFEFVDAARIVKQRPPQENDPTGMRAFQEYMIVREMHGVSAKALLPPPERTLSLAEKVGRFINDAQVNHRRFFASSGTDLFAQILEKLTGKTDSKLEVKALLERLTNIEKQDRHFKNFGIEVDNWNLHSIQGQMEQTATSPAKDQAVVALGAFVEMLEARTAERALLANRLEIFIRVIGEFFHDKTISVSPRTGLVIKTNPPEKRTLKEYQLSTGEYHLLYLMVAALVTQRRGTVLAIDEPEMSMHLAWQRKLISGLFQCASRAEPQFIFATHSPDVAADFPEALVELGK
jgi:predicted ATPase